MGFFGFSRRGDVDAPEVVGGRVAKIRRPDGGFDIVKLTPFVVVPNNHLKGSYSLLPELDPWTFQGTTAEYVAALKKALAAIGYGPED